MLVRTVSAALRAAPSLLIPPLLAYCLAGCGTKSSADNATTPAPSAMPVQVIVAAPKPVADTTEYLSILKSRHSAIINPQVEGYITKIFVKSGDRVESGAPLLQIDPVKQEATLSSQDAARAAQQVNVRNAKISLDRAQKLFDAGVISKQDLDNAQASYDAAAEQLKSLEHQVRQQDVELGYYRVSAPMSGLVGDIPVRVGDRVTVSTLLTTVDEPGALEVYIYVPASRSPELRLGLPVRLLDENGSLLAQTSLTFVSPQVDPETQTVLAKAAIAKNTPNLRIAQQVRAQLVWSTRQQIVVPILAVQRINGQFFAFVADKGAKGTTAQQTPLKIGDTAGNDYAVLDGIHPGDHVIVSGLQFLQQGAPVAEQVQQQVAPGPGNSQNSRPK
jgi:RND family efflux transporter MFP subunit